MLRIIINGNVIHVPHVMTIMQACDDAHIPVPRFCYHKHLSVVAHCRMCLVEVSHSSKLVAACSFLVEEGMEIYTETQRVREVRSSTVTFLLFNHPLECPICDQAGACDLQDYATRYGYGHTHAPHSKRSAAPLDLGPLIGTHMSQCIHCTRCTRFMDEVAGAPEMGFEGRGNQAHITTTARHGLTSPLVGNLVDICPVGALTDAASTMRARAGEYRPIPSIDIMDADRKSVV